MKRLILMAVVVLVAVVVGLLVSIGAIDVMNLFLPPFGPGDDDTMREYIPVAIATGIGGLASLGVIVVAWLRLRSQR